MSSMEVLFFTIHILVFGKDFTTDALLDTTLSIYLGLELVQVER